MSTKSASATETHIQQFEKKISEVKKAHAHLPKQEFYDELLTIIHRPGWTTLPETMFFEAALEAIHAQTHMLTTSHERLMNAAKMVGVQQ